VLSILCVVGWSPCVLVCSCLASLPRCLPVAFCVLFVVGTWWLPSLVVVSPASVEQWRLVVPFVVNKLVHRRLAF